MSLLYDAVSKFSQSATKAEFEAEVKKANAEYFGLTGQVYEEDRSFEARMGLFLEWYLFDRLLESHAMTPLQVLLKNPPPEFTPEEIKVLEGLQDHPHSVYEFSKAKENVVHVVDLSNKKVKLQVYERRGTVGFMKGDIFEARLFPFEGKLHFSGPMLFHPRGALKFIRRMFKENPERKKAVILSLSAMSLKLERYRHVPLEKIYSNLM